MTTINTLLGKSLSGGSSPLANLQLRLESPLPALGTGQSLTATVTKSSLNGQLMLTLPSGEQITATANPPLAAGTKLTLTPQPAATPSQPGQAATPTTAPASTVPAQVSVRITLPNGTILPDIPLATQPTANGTTLLQAVTHNATSLPTAPQTPPAPASATALASNTTKNAQFPTLTLNIANISAKSVQTALLNQPFTQQTIPQGPLEYTFTQQTSPQLPLNQPLQLTLQSPTSGQLTVGNQTVAITLPTPLPVPTGQPLPVTLVANPNAPQTPVLLLTQNIATTTATTTPQQPLQPPQLSAFKAILNPGQPASVPLNTPIAARVLAPQTTPTGQPGTPLLLATGHKAVLQSPQPLAAGDIVVVEFPIVTGPAQVIKVQSGGGQQTPQPQTQGSGNTAPAQPSAPTLTLPPGTQVQGLITGQTEQGLPLFTIQSPPQYAGHTIPITLPPEAQHHLPEGTRLTIQVQPGGTANVLNIALPQAAQRANTLTHLAQQWPGLQQALSLLQNQAPQVAQALQNQLPQLQALLPGLVTFVEALRRNSPELALGKEAHTLLRSMGLDLTSDVSQLSQLQHRQEDTQWRGTLFPYIENTGEDPRQGGFFWRREKKDDARSRTSTRFIMQLNLSQMGDVQLDGLVNYPEIWLKLRRTTQPEEGFITQLQNLVNGTLEQYGLSGGITVETAATFPVNPLAELLATTPNPLPTTA